MKISVISLNNQRGFSIPELLVVIAIISLSVAVVLPNFSRIYESFGNRISTEEIIDRINELGRVAAQKGVRITRDSFEETHILSEYFPEGWTVEGDFSFSINGSCTGGSLKLLHYEKPILKEELTPPFCQLNFDG